MRPDTYRWLAGLVLPLVAGCTAVPQPSSPQGGGSGQRPGIVVPPTRPAQTPQAGFRAPQVLHAAGLDGVIEQDAASLLRQFGNARLDVTEGDMRKLQFAGSACVLDIYLYPLRERGEPVATHVEARRPSDGHEVDRVACVAALRR